MEASGFKHGGSREVTDFFTCFIRLAGLGALLESFFLFLAFSFTTSTSCSSSSSSPPLPLLFASESNLSRILNAP